MSFGPKTWPARSWLFTPATRPERFGKAAGIGADVSILDLEDAVAPADKESARATALDHLARPSPGGPARAVRKGFAHDMTKAVLNGRADEVVELACTNLLR